jgi:hypothetical protein
VKLIHAQAGLATHGALLVEAAQHRLPDRTSEAASSCLGTLDGSLTARAAGAIYQAWLNRLQIPQRFPQTDWSIADKWIAKELLWRRTPVAQVQAILQLGSPGFPRRHTNPDDYLRRTAARALAELHSSPFPGRDPSAPRHDWSAAH